MLWLRKCQTLHRWIYKNRITLYKPAGGLLTIENMEGVNYMKHYYIEKSKMNNFLKEITAAQQKANIFSNVSVKPYRGKKYDPRNTVVVVVG